MYTHIQYVDKCTNENVKLKLLAEPEAITTDYTRVKGMLEMDTEKKTHRNQNKSRIFLFKRWYALFDLFADIAFSLFKRRLMQRNQPTNNWKNDAKIKNHQQNVHLTNERNKWYFQIENLITIPFLCSSIEP